MNFRPIMKTATEMAVEQAMTVLDETWKPICSFSEHSTTFYNLVEGHVSVFDKIQEDPENAVLHAEGFSACVEVYVTLRDIDRTAEKAPIVAAKLNVNGQVSEILSMLEKHGQIQGALTRAQGLQRALDLRISQRVQQHTRPRVIAVAPSDVIAETKVEPKVVEATPATNKVVVVVKTKPVKVKRQSRKTKAERKAESEANGEPKKPGPARRKPIELPVLTGSN